MCQKRKTKEAVGSLLKSQDEYLKENAKNNWTAILSWSSQNKNCNQTVNKDYLDKKGDRLRIVITEETVRELLLSFKGIKVSRAW